MSDNPYSNPLWYVPGYQPPPPKKKIVSYAPPAQRSTAGRQSSTVPWYYNALNTISKAPILYRGGTWGNLIDKFTGPRSFVPNAPASTAKNPYTIHYTPYPKTIEERAAASGWNGPVLSFQGLNTEGAKAVRLYEPNEVTTLAGLPPGGVPGIPEHYWNPYLDPVLGDAEVLQQKWYEAGFFNRQTQSAPRSSRSGYSGYYGGYGGGGYGGGGGGYSTRKEPNVGRWYSELINWRI